MTFFSHFQIISTIITLGFKPRIWYFVQSHVIVKESNFIKTRVLPSPPDGAYNL